MEIKNNYSLKKLNTFGIEVSSKYFVEVENLDEIRDVLSDEKLKTEQQLILGGGSNILFTKNFNGIVVKNNLKKIELVNEDQNSFYVKAAAGENWHYFVQYCIANNYAGVENLSLIPGNVGASPMQNIGAYGVEIKDVFYELEALNKETFQLEKFNNQQCNFGYRESVFKRELKDKYIITSVTFKLNKKPIYNTSYGAIEEELQKMNVKEISISAIGRAVCNIRNSKLPNPNEIGNAGSFFKNPVVKTEQFEQLKSKYPIIVGYAVGEKFTKLAAGWLIENCGLKGYRKGDAGVHSKQALVLVNYGNATGNELFDLSQYVIETVNEKFAVTLEREVNLV